MPHPRYATAEITRIGQEIYDRQIRAQVETEENIGRLISIDIETGDYEIGDDPIVTAGRLLSKHPGAAIYGGRIGYNATYTFGGTLTRTAP